MGYVDRVECVGYNSDTILVSLSLRRAETNIQRLGPTNLEPSNVRVTMNNIIIWDITHLGNKCTFVSCLVNVYVT